MDTNTLFIAFFGTIAGAYFFKPLLAAAVSKETLPQKTPAARRNAVFAQRLSMMQAMLVPMRDPELLALLKTVADLLKKATCQPDASRPKNIGALMRQAQASTMAFASMPRSDVARADYIQHLQDLADKLTAQRPQNASWATPSAGKPPTLSP